MTIRYPIVLETEASGAVSGYEPGLPIYAAAVERLANQLRRRAIVLLGPAGRFSPAVPRETADTLHGRDDTRF